MILRKRTILIALIILTACGSSERVITDEGKVYQVKGSKIENNGVEVTESLSKSEKLSINEFLEKKEKEKETFKKKQNEFEDAIAEQEKIQEEAKKKRKKIEDKLEDLENNFQDKLDARDYYVNISKRYNEKKNEYKKLKREGKLSPNNIEYWKEKLTKLKQKVKEAKAKTKYI